MTKAGRNEPCLYGSGKKHKKFCLLTHQHLPNFDLPHQHLRESTGLIQHEWS